MTARRPSTRAECDNARRLLESAIDGFLTDSEAWRHRGKRDDVPEAVREDVEALCDEGGGYRDAALTLLAFPAGNGTVYDITDRFPRDRGTSNFLGRLLRQRNIPAVSSALQNSSFRHSFVHEAIQSDSLRTILLWASSADRTSDEIRRVFERIARRTAETARQVPPLPRIDATRLTYKRTVALTDLMLSEGSGGACEQYTFAALKAAEIEAVGEGLRVATKNVQASDAGRVAADVQVMRGQAEVVEAYEVTTRPWREKIAQTAEVLRVHALPRAHIVGKVADASATEIEAAVSAAQLPTTVDAAELDLSVLDLRHEVHSLIARLTKAGRRRFVEHLWQFLVNYDEDRHVSRLVAALGELDLIAAE